MVSAVASAKTADTSDCTSGAINGICIGMVFLCICSVLRTCYRLVTDFMVALWLVIASVEQCTALSDDYMHQLGINCVYLVHILRFPYPL